MRIDKPYSSKQYADLAVYCNKNSLIIVDKGDYLESENQPEPTIEEKQTQVRLLRNQYLANTDIYMIVDFPITEEERNLYKEYRQYLREFTEQGGWWNKHVMTFDEWKE